MKLLLVAPPSMTTVVSAHRAAQPGERLVAGPAAGDDLGDHRVEVGGNRVALAHAGVDPDAGAGGQFQQRDPARRRGEVAVGVLGVEPGLDGVAGLGRRRARSSRPPAATWICAFTRSRPVVTSVIGCSTCSRVLTSRNAKNCSPGWYRNSTVPAPQ